MGGKNATPLKFDSKAVGGGISAVFSNFEKCRPGVADAVISSVALDQVGMDVRVKFGDSTLNRGLIIRRNAKAFSLNAIVDVRLRRHRHEMIFLEYLGNYQRYRLKNLPQGSPR